MKSLPQPLNFLGIEPEYSGYDNSEIAIVSAPYERTVSYGKGTYNAPEKILEASHYVEFWDEEFLRELCFDKGICTFPSLDTESLSDIDAMAAIEKFISSLLDDEKFVVTIGGEHTISQACIRAFFNRRPNMSVLHFDAHSDLRNTYEESAYNHACVMARVLEFLPPKNLVQVGIRAQCKEEADFIRKKNIQTFYAHAIRNGTFGEDWQAAVCEALNDEIYITFDVDYFDPSLMPSTGTPEPGGFFWDETIRLLKHVGASKKIIGFDVVELAPNTVLSFPTYLTSKLVYKILNAAYQGR